MFEIPGSLKVLLQIISVIVGAVCILPTMSFMVAFFITRGIQKAKELHTDESERKARRASESCETQG